jgi:hypothetical protein
MIVFARIPRRDGRERTELPAAAPDNPRPRTKFHFALSCITKTNCGTVLLALLIRCKRTKRNARPTHRCINAGLAGIRDYSAISRAPVRLRFLLRDLQNALGDDPRQRTS